LKISNNIDYNICLYTWQVETTMTKAFVLKNQTLGGIQSLSQSMWDEEIFEGYNPNGKYEYLNNKWVQKAIEYAVDTDQISKNTLYQLASEQIEKSQNNKGKFLTKTGRLAYVIMDFLIQNPTSEPSKDIIAEDANKNYIETVVETMKTDNTQFNDPIEFSEEPVQSKTYNSKSDVKAKSEYVKILKNRGYNEIKIANKPSDIIACKNAE